jgi:hypothetical protein
MFAAFFSATSIGLGSLDSLFILFFLKGFLKIPLPAHRTHAFLYILSFSRQFHLSLPYLTFGFPEAFYISWSFGHLNRFPYLFLIHRLSYGSLLCILCFPWIFRGLYFSLFSFRLWPVLGTHAFHFLFLVLSIASTWDSRLSCLLFSFLFDDQPFS